MNNLFQLRNKLSSRILTDNQQKNTKGRGKGDIGRQISLTYEPVTTSPATPTISNTPTTTQPTKGANVQRPGGGPPQFVPGGTNPFRNSII